MVQITMVVKNTPVMEINPWRTGDFVLAAAAIIGELPRPASLVYTPLAIPVLMAVITDITAVPATPPPTAWGVKAA